MSGSALIFFMQALAGGMCGLEFRELAGAWFAPREWVRILPELEGVGFHSAALRLECSGSWGKMNVLGALEGHASWSTSGFFPLAGPLSPEPLRWPFLLRKEDTVGRIVLDGEALRLEATFQGSFFKLGVGRMPVHPGVSRVAGVLDVVTPRPPTTLDPGTEPTGDFLRLWAFRGVLGGGILFHNDSSWLLLARMDRGYGTLGALGGELRGERFVGGYGEWLDDPFVLWIEGRVHSPIAGEREWATETGLTYLYGEHEVSLALETLAPLSRTSRDRLIQKGFRWLGDEAYAFSRISWTFRTLNRLEGLGILNLHDGSALLQAFLYRDLSERQDLALWVFRGMGDLNDEFGPLGWGVGLYWRYVE